MATQVHISSVAALGAATAAAIGRHLDRTFRAMVRYDIALTGLSSSA